MGVDDAGRVVAVGTLQHVLTSAAPHAKRVGETTLLVSSGGLSDTTGGQPASFCS
jgi:hypothetical protein